MEVSDPPSKRLKPSPLSTDRATFNTDSDFVSLDFDGEDHRDDSTSTPLNAPTGPRSLRSGQQGARRIDPRNRFDRPKSKHALPGFEPWVLIKTKLGRRFVHNTQSAQSFWRVPRDVRAGVEAFELADEKKENAKWAEEQLKDMRGQPEAGAGGKGRGEIEREDGDGRARRRRSESLQREDEQVMLAELAADAEKAEERDAEAAAKAVAPLEPKGYVGDASDSEYEYIEVTDTEGEDVEPDANAEARPEGAAQTNLSAVAGSADADAAENPDEQGPVEFGEDDIAYQLAMMGESYGLDPSEYTTGDVEGGSEYEEGAEGLPLSTDEAAMLFRGLLDEYDVSPFTTWETLITDTSDSSIVLDDRYTVLPSMKARKDVWARWSRDKAAQVKAERAREEKKDPRIPYLALLAEKASPKLYWPEFKRKFKREPELSDRSLQDRDREKLYREFISSLKTDESKRRKEFTQLLHGLPRADLNGDTSLDNLPQRILSSVVFYTIEPGSREALLRSHVSKLPPAPIPGETGPPVDDAAEREKRRKQDAALIGRERRVDEERHQRERDQIRARRELMDSERELEAAMRVRRDGPRGLL